MIEQNYCKQELLSVKMIFVQQIRHTDMMHSIIIFSDFFSFELVQTHNKYVPNIFLITYTTM